MNEKILQQQLLQELMNKLQKNCPYDTGNLQQNGIRLEKSGNKARVVIGGEPAPYAPWTEEHAKDPKKHWIQKSVNEMVSLCKSLGGEIK